MANKKEETPAQPSSDGTPQEPTPEQLGIEPDAPKTPTKEVAPEDVNTGDISNKKAKLEPETNAPQMQASTGAENVAPIRPEPPTASEVADALNINEVKEPVKTGSDKKGTYTLEAGDLNNHPELSQQGLKHGQELEYGKHWVYKYPTADRSNIVQVPWPTDVSGGKL